MENKAQGTIWNKPAQFAVPHTEAYEEDVYPVDTYDIIIGSRTERMCAAENERCDTSRNMHKVSVKGYAPELTEEEHTITVNGENFRIVFSKETGLMTEGMFNDEKLIESGPYLNLYGAYYKPSVFQNNNQGVFHMSPSGWKCSDISWKMEADEAVICISGTYPGGTHLDAWEFRYGYDPMQAVFEIRIDGAGCVKTVCTILNPPQECLLECGVSYILSDLVDRLTWKREAVYSGYPQNHIGRPQGTAYRYRGFGKDTYRQEPQWHWSQDETNYVLYGGEDQGGHGTNDFISSREHIYYASAVLAEKKEQIRAESDGKSVAVRVCPARDEDPDLPDGIKFTMNTELYYDLGNGSSALVKSGDGYLGNYTYPEVHLENGHTFAVQMRLTD